MRSIRSVLLFLILLLSLPQEISCSKREPSGNDKEGPEDTGGDVVIQVDPDAPLKIGTFNIEGPSCENPKSIGYWPNRKNCVIKLLNSADFDIFGTQENHKEMLDDMVAALPQYEWIGLGRKTSLSINAIVYKKERFTLLERGRFNYSPTPEIEYSYDPDDTGQKDLNCIWGKFKDNKTGVTFFLFNSHFHASYSNAMRDTLRCRDARILKSKVAEIAGDSYAFCTGDFNCSDISYNNFTGSLIHVARPGFAELMRGGILEDTKHIAEKFRNEYWTSLPGWLEVELTKNDGHYDHILFNTQAAGKYKVSMFEVIVESFEMIHQGSTTTADPLKGVQKGQKFTANVSDHRPVTATIQFVQK